MGLNRCKNGHMFSARKYGDTCPYCNTNLELNTNMMNNKRLMLDDPDKTVSVSGVTDTVDPVTGWLVCIEDPSTERTSRYMLARTLSGAPTTCISRFSRTTPCRASTMPP